MPPSTDTNIGLPSPLTLLVAEAARTDVSYDEVLLLSYTLDLGFFEKVALGASHALGARVTVVGDAAVVTHDPRAVRRAGRSYVPGLARCGGAFHPKLAVMAGHDGATVAIGSGNVTMSGWSGNHELWSVLRGDSGSAPETFVALATWLRTLPEVIQFSDQVPEAMHRVAELLDHLAPADAGPQLVDSRLGRIIDQLPFGPVDSLSVYSPFHDKGSAALDALVGRLDPAKLTVAIQPELTVIDGPAVDAIVSARDGTVIQSDAARYRHGKLLEWEVDGKRWALTGSPNCTSAALLRAVSDGGNCELGLITLVDESRMPAGDAIGRGRLQAHGWVLRPKPRPGLVVLGATRTESGVEVLLAKGAPPDAYVEVSAPSAQPDTWERIGSVTAGATAITVVWGVEGGSRLRVVAESDNNDRRESNTVFVLDVERAVRRRGQGGAVRNRTTEPFDLFRDTGLAESFVSDLGGLRAAMPAGSIGGVPKAGGAGGAATSWAESYGSWEAYLDDCAGRVGYSLMRFALGLPSFATAGAVEWTDVVAAEWDEEPEDDSEVGLEDDETEAVAEEQEAESAAVAARLPSLAAQADHVRRRYRSWAKTLADSSVNFGPTERLLGVRLVLWTIAADAWLLGDLSWVPVLGKVTRSLADPALPVEAEPQTGSLAAVALSVLRAQAPRHRWTPEGRVFNETADAVEYLLAAADEVFIEEYARLLSQAFGPSVHPKVVLDLVHELLEVEALDAALLAFDEVDLLAHRHGRVLHVEGSHSNPQLASLQAVGVAEDHAPVGAWAEGSTGWALTVWRPPEVITATKSADTVVWKHYVLSQFLSPRVVAATDRRLESRHCDWTSSPGAAMHASIAELLSAVGLDDPVPPTC